MKARSRLGMLVALVALLELLLVSASLARTARMTRFRSSRCAYQPSRGW